MPKREKKPGILVRGYDIRIQYEGDSYLSTSLHVYFGGRKGTLPPEWEQIKRDPAVLRALVFLSSERHKPAAKRKTTQEYTRPGYHVPRWSSPLPG